MYKDSTQFQINNWKHKRNIVILEQVNIQNK